jgi:hypothetical protein
MTRTGASPRAGDDAMDAALEILAPTGPEYGGGLANHGPMAAVALVAMERPDAVVPWVEKYRKGLDARPSGTNAIGEGAWREALGEERRVGDWIVFFRHCVEEKPWRDVVSEWTPRLAPGIVAAAFHGVIRAGHAARSLAAAETKARVLELAEGLAYWAANYHELPATLAQPPAGRLPSEAIAAVAHVPQGDRVTGGPITDRLVPAERFPPFLGVLHSVDASGDASAFLSDLTETFAGVFLASVPPRSGLIAFIHGVTGPSAVRLLLPHLSEAACAQALKYAWQGAAAMYAALGGRVFADASGPAPSKDELVDRAVANGDEHAIKFTEACLREHALRPSPVFLHAARHALDQLG